MWRKGWRRAPSAELQSGGCEVVLMPDDKGLSEGSGHGLEQRPV